MCEGCVGGWGVCMCEGCVWGGGVCVVSALRGHYPIQLRLSHPVLLFPWPTVNVLRTTCPWTSSSPLPGGRYTSGPH